MAVVKWRGDAVSVQKIYTITITAAAANTDTVTLTINGKSIVITFSGAVTEANVASAIVNAWSNGTMPTDSSVDIPGSSIPEFTRVSVRSYTGATYETVEFKAKTAGEQFVMSASGYAGLGTLSQDTAASGPNVVQASNFSGAALPGASDDLHIEDTDRSMFWLLDALTTQQSVVIDSTFTGQIGLPPITEDTALTDSNQYYEYRPRYLELGAATVDVGAGDGSGSGRMLLDLGTTACALTAHKTGSSLDTGIHPLRIACNNAASSLDIRGSAQVDVAFEADKSALLGAIKVSETARLRLSERAVWTSLVMQGRAIVDYDSLAASTDITSITCHNDGRLLMRGGNAVTTLTLNGSSRASCYGSGTITTLNVGPAATFDASFLTSSVTITDTNISEGGTINDPHNRLVFTNAIAITGAPDKVNLIFGDDRTLQP